MRTALFLTKRGDPICEQAAELCRMAFDAVTVHAGDWGDKLPELHDWDGDYIISFLSRWIVPGWLLKRVRCAALNFHPAPPEYPGIGCTNFALYEGSPFYGSTCHHMAEQVDTGPIVSVWLFVVTPDDGVESLLNRTYESMLQQLASTLDIIRRGSPLPEARQYHWSSVRHTRQELDNLMYIPPEMGADEIKRRVRATSYKTWKPYTIIDGIKFELVHA